MKKRTATVHRKTRETDIALSLDLDGRGRASVRTGVGFMDHMLELLAKHALLDLKIRARGDTQVDDHHTVEDLGLVLGEALDAALGDRTGIGRYGGSLVPMDEALGQAALDLGGRPYLVYSVAHRARRIRTFDLGLVEEFFRALCVKGRFTLHLAHLYGKDAHHACEVLFKAFARALRAAVERDPRVEGVPSSKGRL